MPALIKFIGLLFSLVIIRAVVSILMEYSDYVPPNFLSDFLLGREAYFWHGYHLAFYAHIAAGPLSLIVGLWLMIQPLRQRFPNFHRCLGRIQIGNIVLFLAPSGLWMSRYAATGAIAGSSFAILSLATAFCALLGWRAAVRKQYQRKRTAETGTMVRRISGPGAIRLGWL